MATHPFIFEKKKYLNLLKSDGISVALTQLHQDTIQWEYEAFEGKEGYQPHVWRQLHHVREFSRELWARALEESGPTQKPKLAL